MTYKFITTFMLLIVLLLGGALGYLILQSRALWLIISIALLLALLAWWQTPCIRVALDNEQNPPKTAPFQCLKHWLLRLIPYVFLVTIIVLGRSVWWSQQPVLMNDSNGQKEQSFPISYAFNKIAWELGFASLPEFVEIPAGTFQMGSMIARDELPINEVTLSSFLMSRAEITFGQYDYYIWSMHNKLGDKQAINYSYDDGSGWITKNFSTDNISESKIYLDLLLEIIKINEDRNDKSVKNISWHDVQGYTNWLSKRMGTSCRLPSEAELKYISSDEVTIEKKFNRLTGLEQIWAQDCYSDIYKGTVENGFLWEVADCKHYIVTGIIVGMKISVFDDSLKSDTNLVKNNGRADKRSAGIGFKVVCNKEL